MNTDKVFTKYKIGIGTIVHNHPGIPLLAKALPCQGRFTIDYGELIGIIKGFVLGSSIIGHLIIESDYLLGIRSLSSQEKDL